MRVLNPIILFSTLVASSIVNAQIVRDGTIGPDQSFQVAPVDGRYNITEDMGERSGDNLFHSFDQFNVLTGEQAVFYGDASIENVISRVTGGSVSHIDGLVRSTVEGANFFLINPSGLVFGANAQLQVDGSINFSTGTLSFADGEVFTAQSGQLSTILSTAAPGSFGFLSEEVSSSIDLRGVAFWLESDFNLSAQNINISDGAVVLSGLGYDIDVDALHDVTLTGDLSRMEILTVDAFDGGTMDVNARNIYIEEGASLGAVSFGTGAPGEINISVSELVQLRSDGRITTFNYSPAEGANIAVTANIIDIGEFGSRGALETQSTGGAGGDITLIANERVIGGGTGDIELEYVSFIASFAEGWEQGGDILLSAPSIELDNGFQVLTHAVFGPAGDIAITADDFELRSGSLVRTLAGDNAWGSSGTVTIDITNSLTLTDLDTHFTSVNGGTAAGGDFIVNANTIEVLNGAEFISFTDNAGAGGSYYLNAEDHITFDIRPGEGEVDLLNPRALSYSLSGGDGGDFEFSAPEINLLEGTAIKTGARGAGSGGDIRIEAEDTILVQGLTSSDNGVDTDNLANVGLGSDAGKAPYSVPVILFGSGVYRRSNEFDLSDDFSVDQNATGEGGDIYLQAESIEFRDGAYIETNTDTNGAGGSIILEAEQSVSFIGTNFQGASSLLRTGTEHVSDAGNISITSSDIYLTDGAILFSENSESAAGGTGDIALNATNDITIAGGNPNNLEAPPSLQTVSQNTVDSGAITISSSSLQLQDARLNTETLSGTGGDITLTSDHMYFDNSTVTTSVAGDGNGGDINVSADSLVLNHGSAIIAQADAGNGGAIMLDVDAFAKSADSVVDASSRQGIDGVVSVKPGAEEHQAEAPLEAKYIDASSLMRASCASYSQGNSLTLLQASGAFVSPEGPLPLGNSIQAFSEIPEFSPLASGNSDAFGLAAANNTETSSADLFSSLGNAAYGQGAYRSAVEHLVKSVKISEEQGDSRHTVRAMADLGNTLVAVGKDNAAEKILQSALVQAKDVGDSMLVAQVLNNLGNYYVVRGLEKKAITAYLESLDFARSSGDTSLLATIQANVARAFLSNQGKEESLRRLGIVEVLLDSVGRNEDKAELLINLAKTYELIARESSGEDAGRYTMRAYTHLRAAETIAKEINNSRLLSYAIGNLGDLYQQQDRFDDALVLTRGAIKTAEASGAAESLFRWYWQEAKILWRLNDGTNAIRSYRRALAVIESSRQASIARYESSTSFFKRLLEPVYLDMVNALIISADQKSELTGEEHTVQKLLQEARQVVEQLKTAEMENYFQDECLVRFNSKRKNLDDISTSAAIIYPIILPERLELLVSLPNSAGSSERSLTRYFVDIPSATLKRRLSRFRQHLENYSDEAVIQRQAVQLYQYLVQPYRAALDTAEVNTLVFVPDGALRSIPLSALHSGENYLLHDFSIAMTSSLMLSDPRPIAEGKHSVLLAGVSESVNGLPPLKSVPQELKNIHRMFGGEVLLDEDFTVDAFSENINNADISIVHIASHAKFTGDYQSSFLQTFDQPLYSEELNKVLGTTKYREQQLEMLVLSACQTAAGNDQSALGLAGVGLKAGAQSAMGSLWNISDVATAELIQEFYSQLKTGNVSKAQALRNAQVKLLQGGEYSHPFFWSPFLLLDNWL